uniref:Aromatic amino acid beta-eliminating lyase/threonine aldolase domain-containing protein n=1 Tax=Plectus sambesii TaxID=2011161 RepID=A0A914XE84_9BILA
MSAILRAAVNEVTHVRQYQPGRVVSASKVVDMRSDTVTRPSPAMRKAMAEAVVGDDVYGEDVTVNELERKCAEYFGKESALFVLSGSMGNLLAVMSHCGMRGSEMIVGQQAHMHRWEQGGYAQLAGVSATTLVNEPDGTIALDAIETAVRDGTDFHQPTTQLLCLENTHNYRGGVAITVEYMQKVRTLADKYGFRVHIDGARLLNAAVALSVSADKLVADADSIQMCFSKGLGAPMGSILCGDKAFIERARRSRKAVGGGWRQAGILAAAASMALENGVQTVTRDHTNAVRLATELNRLASDKFSVNMNTLQTNIIMVQLRSNDAATLCEQLGVMDPAVLCSPFDADRIRLVTHCDIQDSDIDVVVNAFAKL